MKCILLILLILIGLADVEVSFGQTGGYHSFQNLNMNYSARTMSLGGDVISNFDPDINFTLSNPALLQIKSSGHASLSQTIMASGVNTGLLTYGKQFGQYMGAAHFRYVAYGNMKRTDVNGTDLGNFSPGDFIFGVSGSKAINERMFIGATLNFLYSQMDNYTSFGNSVDIGGYYFDSDKNLSVAGVIKNLGYQWKGFNGEHNLTPLEVQLGITHKLKHAPFRFSLIAQHLQTWDLTYSDPNAKERVDPLTGEIIKPKQENFIGKLARHGKIQVEILLGKKLSIHTAFDYQRRKELAVTNRGGMAGFSLGMSVNLKRFRLDYGWSVYSVAGGQHGLSITIPLVK